MLNFSTIVLTYSFIQHPLERILASLESTFPGMNDAMILFVNYHKELEWSQFTDSEIKTNSTKQDTHLFQKFRKDKGTFLWTQESSISFLNNSKKASNKIKQLSFADEESTNLLCLKFLSPLDHQYDCLIIKIENTSLFGMSKSGSQLTVQEKNIIGKLLYQTLSNRIKEEYNNNDTHRLVLGNIQLQHQKINNLEEERALLKSNYKKSLLYFIHNVMNRMSEKFKMTVALSEKAEELLMNQELDITALEKSLIQGAHMAANLTLHYSTTILIHPENLTFQTEMEENAIMHSNDKHAPIIEILDRYEEAAEKAKAKNWKINGNSVAELCSPAVTPSAITFNLKKYSKQINILLDRYDEKWSLLRTHFKPLKNIIEVKQSELSKYKSA